MGRKREGRGPVPEKLGTSTLLPRKELTGRRVNKVCDSFTRHRVRGVWREVHDPIKHETHPKREGGGGR